MFSEKSHQAWKARQGAIEEAERARIRAQITQEVDGALDDIRVRREVEHSRERFLSANRHARAVTAPPRS